MRQINFETGQESWHEELNRPWCELFGCVEFHAYDPVCKRCGTYYYEGYIFQEESIFWPAWWKVQAAFWWTVRLAWRWRRCDVCKKWFWGERGFGFWGTYVYDPCCSKECWSNYVPF